MIGQPSFSPPRPRKTIQQRFEDFHAAHPVVYEWFRHFAHEARRVGFRRYSAHLLIHQIRWTFDIQRGPSARFKINDQFASRFARLLIANEPGVFTGFFELRQIKSP